MSSKTKTIFPLAMAMLLASCGGQPQPSSHATGLSSSSEASKSEPTSSETSQTSATSSSSSSAKKDHFIEQPTEISFWAIFNDSYASNIEAAIEAFKELEPNVTVKYEKQNADYTGMKDKVVDNLSARTYPDLFVGYPDSVQELMQYDAVVQLDEYIDNEEYGWTDEDKEDIIQSYVEEGRTYPQEGTWSVPLAKSTEAMYYNRDVLIGLDLREEDATINDGKLIDEAYINNLTWEELFGKLAPAIVAKNEKLPAKEKILRTNGSYVTSVFGYDSDDNLFITLAEQYGYGYTDVNTDTGVGEILFNNPEMKKVLKDLNKYRNLDTPYFITKGTNDDKYTNYNFVAQCSLFSVGSTGGVSYQVSEDFDTGVAKIPHAEGRDPKVINQGPSMAILDHQDENRALASWLFYKFFTNEENATRWSINTGYSPIRYSTLSSPEYIEYAEPEGKDPRTLEILNARVAKYLNEVGDDLYSSPVFKGSSKARSEVSALTKGVVGKKGISDSEIDSLFEQAFTNAVKAM